MSRRNLLKIMVAALLVGLAVSLAPLPTATAASLCGFVWEYVYQNGGYCIQYCVGGEQCYGNPSGKVVKSYFGRCYEC
jgi:hypothetical protein